MRAPFRFIIFVSVSVVSAAATPLARDYAPRVEVRNPHVNFGERMDTEIASCTYVISNRGNLSLRLGSIHSSCGCTDIRLPSQVIAPGNSVEMEVDVDLRGRSGVFTGELLIETNDPRQRELRLSFQAMVASSIEISPRHVFFRALGREDTATISSTVRFKDEPTSIGSVLSRADFIDVEFDEVEPGREYRIDVSTVPPLGEGRVNTDIIVKDESGEKIFDIPVWIQILSDIEYSPNVIVLHPDDAVDARRQIVLTYGRVSDFSIERVLVPAPSIEVSVHELEGHGYRIQLIGVPPRADMNGKSIIIQTDLDDADPIEIPLVYDDTD